MQGRFELAQRYGLEALTSFQEASEGRLISPAQPTALRQTLAGDPVDIGRTYRVLGALCATRPAPDLEQALDYHQRALRIFEQAARKREAIGVLVDLANVYMQLADYERAQEVLQECHQGATQLGDRPTLAVVLVNFALIAHFQERYEEARTLFAQAVQVTEEVKDYHYLASFAAYACLALLEQGQEELAKGYLQRTLKARRVVGGAMCGSASRVALVGWLLARGCRGKGKKRAVLLQVAQQLLLQVPEEIDVDFRMAAKLLQVVLHWLASSPQQAQACLTEIEREAKRACLGWVQQKAEQLAERFHLTLGEGRLVLEMEQRNS